MTPTRLLHLDVSLSGVAPATTRRLAIREDLTLTHLHEAIQIAFHGDRTAHHVFCDRDPFPYGLPHDRDELDHQHAWHAHYGYRDPATRRWGDRWTMIDLRDPDVRDASTMPVAAALRGVDRLHYRSGDPHGDDELVWFRIDAVGDEAGPAGAAPVRLIGATGPSPLDFGRVRDYAVCLAALYDPSDPDHDAARDVLDRATGPWASFDAGACDVDGIQRRLDERWASPRPATVVTTPLARLIDAVSPPARAGLRRHVQAAGLHVPPLLAEDEVARFTAPFAWLVRRAVEGTLPVVDRRLGPESLRAWADAVDADPDDLPAVLATARALGLVRTFRGALATRRPIAAAADRPLDLWTEMAAALFTRRHSAASPTDDALLCLAIADGSIGDDGWQRIAHAQEAIAADRAWMPWTHDRHRPRLRRSVLGGFDTHDRVDEHGSAQTTREPRHRPDPMAAQRSLASFTALLEPLGLTAHANGGWSASAPLVSFARAALTGPITSAWAADRHDDRSAF
ncbi:IS1096 element passenger TnpR family protein [Microbacterium sp. No. 7]|uniref:IS1096 element passenger TnpR family protein n=1 Tax=Microbacterium sp. No. 7 TaxID=1714373 RepID=UPI0006D0A644|nr:hypothetical protein [Microbacterium sp. No. 7]ALJ19422.1 hypothetical protein AOA12_05675 [Microbacterium sp. No. 7]